MISVHRSPRIGTMVLFCVAWTWLAAASHVHAQSEIWRVGQGGATWESEAEVQVGAVAVENALQPLELVSDRNLTQLLAGFGQEWQNGPPEDYRVQGRPHAWSNSVFFNTIKGPLSLVDGDPDTGTGDVFKSMGNPAGTAFFLDLGTVYPVNRIRFYTPADEPDSYMRAFELWLNDGKSFTASRQPQYSSLRRVESNDQIEVDFEFAIGEVRFVQLKNLSRTPFDLAEIEVYGEGFVPASEYRSVLHDFGRPMNFGTATLEATRLGEGAMPGQEAPVCVLRVRTGRDDSPLTYFRLNRETSTEVEVTEAEYENRLPRLGYFREDPKTGEVLEEMESRDEYLALPVEEQGPVRDFVQGAIRTDAENWSPWSAPIEMEATGTYSRDLDLAAPRRYVQLWFDFAGDAHNAVSVNSFALEYTPLLADAAIGEVALAGDPSPVGGTAEVAAAVETLFTCDIRSKLDTPGLPGYQGVRVASLPPPTFAWLEKGDPLVRVNDAEVQPTEDGFQVLFEPVTAANNEPMRIAFRQTILEHSTPIQAWLLGQEGQLRQPVEAGNANDLVTTDELRVYTADPAPRLKVDLSAPVITPNNDGANDQLKIEYMLIQFGGNVTVKVDVLDLAGRRWRRLVAREVSAGAYNAVWDGTGADGGTVPPGTYLCRIEVDAEARNFSAVRAVGVAY